MHSNWLLKLWISFAIDLRISFVFDCQGTCAGFVPKRIVIVCCWNKGVKIIFLCFIISLFSNIKTFIHLSVGGWWWIFTSLYRGLVNIYNHLHFGDELLNKFSNSWLLFNVYRDLVMLVFTPVVIFTVQELGVLGSWREMEISSMQMELILKNLRTTNWYSV